MTARVIAALLASVVVLTALAVGCTTRPGTLDVVYSPNTLMPPAPKGVTMPQEAPTVLFSLMEADEDSATQAVAASGIVDVNSRLDITLQRAAVEAACVQRFPGRLDGPRFAALQSLLSAVRDGQKQMEATRAALTAWANSTKDHAAQMAFETAMAGIATATAQILNRSAEIQVPGLREAFNRRIDALPDAVPIVDQYVIFMEEAAARGQALHEDLLADLTAKGVFVQFGAWIATGDGITPLHLPGFDRYPEGGQFSVERIAIVLDDQQRAKLAAYRDAAKALNEDSDKSGSVIASTARAMLERLVEGFELPLQSLVDEAQKLATGAVSDVTSIVARIHAAIGGYRESLRQLAKKYRQVTANDPVALLTEIADDLESLSQRTEGLLATVTNEAKELAGLAAAKKEEADALVNKAKTAFSSSQEAWRQLSRQLRLLLAGRSIDRQALSFGAEVDRLRLDKLPAATSLSLLTSGRRAPGDKLLFRLAAGRVDQPEGREILAERELTMYQVLWHVSATPLLMFANPAGTTAVQQDFQVAPAYSVLLKPGCRDNHFWNRFFDPGIGLTFAGLDFDADDNLEIGVAGTVSIFRDWIQLGYGYNFGTSDEFWFVGGAIPLSSMLGTSR